jgi:cytidine deaminase
LSDFDTPGPKPLWPSVERRSHAERRAERSGTPVSRRTGTANEDLEVRTPRPMRRDERRSGRDRRDDSAWEAVPLEITIASEADLAEALVAAAIFARTRAQARYSRFKVGAALETSDGAVVTGCNIENATYGLTLCAERVALVKALSEGHAVFTRIVVVADTETPTPPCGPCRQLLWEYCGDIEVILANLEQTTATLRLAALLPMPFDARLLE